MRMLLQVVVGLAFLGLVGGWFLRSRLRPGAVRVVLALAFAPFVVHAGYVGAWALSVGVAPLVVWIYLAACLVVVAGAWWWARRTARTRPYRAPLALPAAAVLQIVATQLLGDPARAAGVIINPLPGVVLFAVSVAIAAALVVLLPPRDPRPFGSRGPRWWRALGRLGRRE